MVKDFYILGEFVGTSAQKTCPDDICPSDFIEFVKTLDDTDEVLIHINSCGGDVFCGFQIANIIKNMKQKTTCIIEGLCASISSAVACACDNIKMYKNSYLMCHRCWSVVQGNSETLLKEIEQMKKIDTQIIDFYTRHFNMSKEDLEKMMSEETWISSDDLDKFGLDIEVIDDEIEYKIAAKLTKFFNKCPINMKNNEEIQEVKEETVEEKKEETETVENPVVEEVTEEKTEEETTEETQTVEEKTEENVEDPENTEEDKDEIIKTLKEEIESLKTEIETLKNEDVDKRVSGMQSKMQNKINDMIKDHTEKISKYENEIKGYQEKLEQSEKNSINLKDKLEKTEKELSEKISALSEKESALTQLNSGVLRQSDLLPSFADGLRNCKTLKDRVDFINSGKYTK